MIRRSVIAVVLVLGFQAVLMAVLHATAFGEGSQVVTAAPPCVNVGGTGVCFSTIQGAINAASPGDVISVAAGTYKEHISMKDGVSVHGQGWPTTIIDGEHSVTQSVVYFPGGVSASTVLSGVQILRGGAGDLATSVSAGLKGGGIYTAYGSPTIVNTWVNSCTARYGGGVYVQTGASGGPTFDNVPVWNSEAERGGGFYLDGSGGGDVTISANPLVGTDGIVQWNSATDEGGGFYISDATVSLTGLRVLVNTAAQRGGGAYITNSAKRITFLFNIITGNTTTGSSVSGAGIYTYNATDLQILGNIINLNTASGDGGGAVFSNSGGLVQTNWFIDNTSTGALGGGAIVFGTSSGLTLRGNWFEGNSAGNGGGLSLDSGATPTVDANTFVDNTAALGGGIYLYLAGAASMTNNIIAGNRATGGAGGGVAIVESPGQLINNTIADNTGDGVWFAEAEGVAIVNNIISDNSGDGIERYALDPTTLYTADYNDLRQNGDGNYENITSGTYDNDMTDDPKFVGTGDAFQYYHIQGTSPVKETGSVSWSPMFDIDWDARVFGGGVSMGADEIPVAVVYQNSLPLVLRSY